MLTFERLLIDSGLPAALFETAVVLRAGIRYSQLVTLAIMERNPTLALEAYKLAKQLPSTATAERLRIDGYELNGLLHERSELVICYKGERVDLLKSLRPDEAARARIFMMPALTTPSRTSRPMS